ncbi:hypothetical protein H0H93_011335 [Arthromyces matolae]|nr:hypothetical protein H0H93_011335 [Arthromyces matolae]
MDTPIVNFFYGTLTQGSRNGFEQVESISKRDFALKGEVVAWQRNPDVVTAVVRVLHPDNHQGYSSAQEAEVDPRAIVPRNYVATLGGLRLREASHGSDPETKDDSGAQAATQPE